MIIVLQVIIVLLFAFENKAFAPDCPAIPDHGDPIQIPDEDCHKYWVCTHGMAKLFICPGDLVYNPKLKVCDRPSKNDSCHSVTSSSTSTSTSTTETSSTISTTSSTQTISTTTEKPIPVPDDIKKKCAEHPGNEFLCPYPGDCTKYIHCYENGVAEAYQCENGTVFNGMICEPSNDNNCNEIVFIPKF